MSFNGTGPTTEDLANRPAVARWATQAGFSTVYEAENAGCYANNAYLFAGGQKVREEAAARPPRGGGMPPAPQVITAFSLLQDFKPIESTIDGLPVGRGNVVSITGPTGAGKTTVSALLQTAFCRGAPFAGREVTAGSVLVLAGENPHDYTMHLAATVQDGGFTSVDITRPKPLGTLLVIPGTFSIDYELQHLVAEVQAARVELVAVFVDTSAAFYGADDENDNVAMRRHASSLRELTTLPGRPTVFVLCHPTKNAQRENLLPRGGGAFLAEVDANLTLWKETSGVISLHWAGKIRGPSFDPIQFELASVELEGVKDCRGKPIFSVAARHVADERAEQIEAKALDDGNRVLLAMLRNPEGSIADWAKAAGMTSGTMQPQKSRVSRLLAGLITEGLAKKVRGGIYRLTPAGKAEAERCL